MKKCNQVGHTRVYYSTGKSDCYQCKKISAAKSRNKPEVKIRKKAYEAKRRATPGYSEMIAAKHRLRKYGISDAPTGNCEICNNKPAKVIDHDHITGQVRGFLCITCNVWLAIIEDKAFVKNALFYLSKNNINAAEYLKWKLKQTDLNEQK